MRRYRLAAGLSQDALAERARVSSAAISALERGQRRTPHPDTRALLAGALALDAEQRREFETAAAPSRSVRGGASVSVGPWPGAAESVLPLALTRFVGRASELAEIAALVRGYRLVTLVGSGGVGKTQTALQVASAMRDAEGATIYFVGLAPLGDPSLVASAIAAALGVQEVPNHPVLETLIAYLKNKALLLILDNCEHVIGEAAGVAYKLLLSCPNLRILATSREALQTAGERAYRLPSLSVSEAIELFTDRARAGDAGFALTEDTTRSVREICSRLDGIPLAIELAAARVSVLAPRQIAERLDKSFSLLAISTARVLSRHQTLTALLDWSYELLSEREQCFFEAFSVFVGRCTLEAATAVCADEGEDNLDVLGLVTSLVTKSLLVAESVGDEQTYNLLESTRDYARQKLRGRGGYERVARRHAVYYVERAEEEANRESPLTPVERELSELTAESGNRRAALEWALLRRGDILLGQRLACLPVVLWRAFAPTEARTWVRMALGAVDEATPPQYVARLEFTDGAIACQFGEHKHSIAAARRALARYRDLGDTHRAARTERLLGFELQRLGERVEGERLLRSALETARALGDRRLTIHALQGIGYIRSALGDYSGACAAFGEALDIANAAGDATFMVVLTLALASNEFNAGDPATSLRLVDDLLATHRRRNTLSSIPIETLYTAQLNTSECLTMLGRYDEATARAKEALHLARQAVMPADVASALSRLTLNALARHPDIGGDTKRLWDMTRLLGFVDVCRERYGIASLEPELGRALESLRDALGSDKVARLMAAGAAMSEDEAVEQARIVMDSAPE